MISSSSYKLLIWGVVLAIGIPTTALGSPPAVATTFTLLHTNDVHGQLQPSGSNPGMARVANQVDGIRTAVGTQNVLLVDTGDAMQGSLLSNLLKGEPTIAVFNAMGYNVASFGNNDFDWGLPVLTARTAQATYPFVTANIVVNDTGDCGTAGWAAPSFAQPYVVRTVGVAPNQVKVGFIGVTTTETPIITVAAATQGLCFKDPEAAILHYYDALKAQADVFVVLSQLGFSDGGLGYGIPVYGDQTLAGKLNADGKPVDLIIGGHSHTNLASATVIGATSVVQAYYNGRNLGRADITVNPDGTVAIAWQRIPIPVAGPVDPAIDTLIASYATSPAYIALVDQPIGYVQVDLLRDYNGDNMMGDFIDDALYSALNSDAEPANDVDVFFNNAGGIRSDWCAKPDPVHPGSFVWSSDAADCNPGVWAHDPMILTYVQMFTILPFGNSAIVGNMTGAQIMELLNQSATLGFGAIQPAGIRYEFYSYADALTGPQPYAWGAFDVCVINRSTHNCDPLDLQKVYRVGTNEFLAPAGGDGYSAFRYMTNITYWGDMLDIVNGWVAANDTFANPYKGPNNDGTLDGRITRDGNDTGGSIVPLTILHHNDSHGNLAKGTYVGYTQLASLILQERAHNPTRTLLLNAGDQIQGDEMMYYFRTAPLGYAADGTPLAPPLTTHPMMAAMNAMGYDAMTLGEHEYDFGPQVFTSVLHQATFPVLQANVSDDGQYGLSSVPIGPYVDKAVGPEGIKVAILGIGNHRVAAFELPTTIPGLTFSDPLTTAQQLENLLRPTNDVVVALTHIGFTTDPKNSELDDKVDTAMAAQVTGLDAILGGHSHTNPATGSPPYKYLPAIVAGPNNTPVLINQAYRYNNTLGEVVIGVRAKPGGGYEVVSRAGRYLTVTMSTPEDAAIKAIVDPYVASLNTYNNKVVGQTTVPIDALQAFTQETNAANLQADASVWELQQHGITVDFHLSGAMTNQLIASGATPASPVTLKVPDLFQLMPFDNSLVVMNMNGPQLKRVLERAYRNYYYYKYVPGYGGYLHYTTCMLDLNSIGRITYRDFYPALPNEHNVASLVINGHAVDFTDASTYYRVSTVNYLAEGNCNFTDSGVSLWPLSQITDDTQYYVRDAVIDYITAMGTVSPTIDGRLRFIFPMDITGGVAAGSTTVTGIGVPNATPGNNCIEVFDCGPDRSCGNPDDQLLGTGSIDSAGNFAVTVFPPLTPLERIYALNVCMTPPLMSPVLLVPAAGVAPVMSRLVLVMLIGTLGVVGLLSLRAVRQRHGPVM